MSINKNNIGQCSFEHCHRTGLYKVYAYCNLKSSGKVKITTPALYTEEECWRIPLLFTWFLQSPQEDFKNLQWMAKPKPFDINKDKIEFGDGMKTKWDIIEEHLIQNDYTAEALGE